MDKFEEKEMMKKKTFAKNTPEPIKHWAMLKTNL